MREKIYKRNYDRVHSTSDSDGVAWRSSNTLTIDSVIEELKKTYVGSTNRDWITVQTKKKENLAGAKGPYKAVSQEFHLEWVIRIDLHILYTIAVCRVCPICRTASECRVTVDDGRVSQAANAKRAKGPRRKGQGQGEGEREKGERERSKGAFS